MKQKNTLMITDDKITEIFCATDEFSKKFDEEIENMPLLTSYGKTRRRRAASMSDSEIMTILIMFHFGTFDNFKHYYLHLSVSTSGVTSLMRCPTTVSWNWRAWCSSR